MTVCLTVDKRLVERKARTYQWARGFDKDGVLLLSSSTLSQTSPELKTSLSVPPGIVQFISKES